jgi:hypothetical protein
VVLALREVRVRAPKEGDEMIDPNAEALRLVRECLTPQARAALGHLLNNALAPVVLGVDLLPWQCRAEIIDEVSRLRGVVASLVRTD